MQWDDVLDAWIEEEYNPSGDIKFNEIAPGLFVNDDYTIMTTDDYYKLPSFVLDKFEMLDKGIHQIVKQINVVLKVEGKEDQDGVRVINSRLQDACYTKPLFEWVSGHEDVRLFLIGINGILLAEHENHFSIIAPYLAEVVVYEVVV